MASGSSHDPPLAMTTAQNDLAAPQLPRILAATAGDVVWLYQPPQMTSIAVAGAFAELFGRPLPSDARISHRWKVWVHPDEQTTVSMAFDKGIANGTYNQVYRLVHPDGAVRWVHDRCILLGSLGVVRITSDFSPHFEQEVALATARQRAQSGAPRADEMGVVVDEEGKIREASPRLAEVLAVDAASLVGRSFTELLDPIQRSEALAILQRARTEGPPAAASDWKLLRGKESAVWIEASVRVLPGEGAQQLLVTGRDVTQRKETELRLARAVHELEKRVTDALGEIEAANGRARDLDRVQRKILLALPDVLMRCRVDSTVIDVSGPVQQMVAPPLELIGSRFVDRPEVPEAVRTLWLQTLQRAVESGRNQICEYHLNVMAGQREFEARFTPVGPDEVVAIVRDIAERNRLRERVQHVAMHDELTGLLNRNALRERLDDMIKRSPQASIAVMVLDLDRFKQMNDTFGHAIGDTLLKIVANRITRRAGTDSLRARIGGDEFAVAIPCGEGAEARTYVETFTQALITELGNRMRLHGESLYLTPSVGIAFYPTDAREAETLLRNADVAMMRAKERGRNSYNFYDPAISAEASSLFNTEQSLRRALDEGHLSCLFQPKIRIVDGGLAGVEALVRWNAENGQVISPERFIPLAERTGLIKPLGRWVLREALRQIAQLPALGRPVPDLAINVSVSQLREAGYIAEVREALAEFNFAANRLTLEVAETAFVDDMQLTSEALGELAHLGVRVSIDDFGTGYGGLSWLKNLPVNEIKIDQTFIKGCAIDAFDANIVSGLVDIAHNLGIQTVAEGVERADQIGFLTQVKCDVIQGFFLSMPMSATELAKTARLWQGNKAPG